MIDPGGAMRVLIAALLPLLSGCATIVQGSTQMVQITSDPPGATATVLPEKITLLTPGEVDLARLRVHTVTFELACHEPATGYLDRTASNVTALNLIFGGLVGMFIDLDSGAAYRLIPDPLHVKLEHTLAGAGSEPEARGCASWNDVDREPAGAPAAGPP